MSEILRETVQKENVQREKRENNIDNSSNVLNELYSLGYPFEVIDIDEFNSQIMSPTNLRYTTIDWLIQFLDTKNFKILESFKEAMQEYSRIEVYIAIFSHFNIQFDKNFTLNELKKAIAGIGSNADSEMVLEKLIEFVKINLEIFGSPNSDRSNLHLKESIMILNYLSDNFRKVYTENLRLFAPEVKPSLENTCSIKVLEERIEGYKKQIEKITKKLEKLRKLDLNYETVEMENLLDLKKCLANFDKIMDEFLKDYNQIYSKELKYIGEDKFSNLHIQVDNFISQYNSLVQLSTSLQELFAYHNRISNFELNK